MITYNQYLYYLCMGGINEIIVLGVYTDPIGTPYGDPIGNFYTN